MTITVLFYHGSYVFILQASVENVAESPIENDKVLIILSLECRHNVTDLKKVVNEGVDISESGEWTLLKDPVAEIQKAVNEEDYFKIVAYALAPFSNFVENKYLFSSQRRRVKNHFL